MTDFAELDALIAAGWGHVRQDRIPPDWRTRKPPNKPAIDLEAMDDAAAARRRSKLDKNNARRRKATADRRAARKTLCPRKWKELPELGRAAGASMTQDHIAPEFRELHEWYCRTAEINEAFLREPAACASQAAAGLVLRYAALNHAIARLIMYIQHDLALEPSAYDAWQRASTASTPPQEQPKPKCATCKTTDGRGVILQDGAIVPCPVCSTPAWREELAAKLNRENLRVRAQIQTGGHQAGDSAVASAAGARDERSPKEGASS